MVNPYYECPVCNEWVEILPTTTTDDFKCPWCGERLRLDADYDNPGMSTQRDLSKLVSFGSHWDDQAEERVFNGEDADEWMKASDRQGIE